MRVKFLVCPTNFVPVGEKKRVVIVFETKIVMYAVKGAVAKPCWCKCAITQMAKSTKHFSKHVEPNKSRPENESGEDCVGTI